MLLVYNGKCMQGLVVKHFDRFLKIILHKTYLFNRLDDLKPKRIQILDFQAIRCTITLFDYRTRFW